MKSKILCKQLILIYKININIIKLKINGIFYWDFPLAFVMKMWPINDLKKAKIKNNFCAAEGSPQNFLRRERGNETHLIAYKKQRTK